eukprot:4203315-Pleurochrysis_carterae.AAC.2
MRVDEVLAVGFIVEPPDHRDQDRTVVADAPAHLEGDTIPRWEEGCAAIRAEARLSLARARTRSLRTHERTGMRLRLLVCSSVYLCTAVSLHPCVCV